MYMQHFKFVNWRIRFLISEQVKRLENLQNPTTLNHRYVDDLVGCKNSQPFFEFRLESRNRGSQKDT